MTERDVASIADLRPDPENAAALDLLHQWQSEDAAYDRAAWARLTTAIDDNRLGYRARVDASD